MNYDELKSFINKSLKPVATWKAAETIRCLDKAIDTLDDGEIGKAIERFTHSSIDWNHDAVFARELIEYIDGLKENQDNGEKTHCCKFNKKSMWHHDFDCKNFVTCE